LPGFAVIQIFLINIPYAVKVAKLYSQKHLEGTNVIKSCQQSLSSFARPVCRTCSRRQK